MNKKGFIVLALFIVAIFLISQFGGNIGLFAVEHVDNVSDDIPIESAIITDVSINKESINPEETITMTVTVENQLDEPHHYLLEGGIIPPQVANDWQYPELENDEGMDWVIWAIDEIPFVGATIQSGPQAQCCQGQENIEDAIIYLEPNEEVTFTYYIDAPYEDIEDKCNNNDYWQGEGDYVSYAYLTTGCWYDSDRKFQSLSTRNVLITSNGGNGGNGGNGIVTQPTSLTWTEYYSMEDKSFMEEAGFCEEASDCVAPEGKEAVCVKEGNVIDRWKRIQKDICDENFGWWNEFADLGLNLIPGGKTLLSYVTGGNTICGAYSEIREGLKGDKVGICMSESDGIVGYWEQALKMVDDLGLPPNYVVMGAIGLIFGLLIIILNLIKS